VAGPNLVAAVDVGGSRMKGALVDPTGRAVFTDRRPTPAAAGPDAVVSALTDFTADLLARGRQRGADVPAAGIAVPGIVDDDRGIAVYSANLGWRDLALRSVLETRLDVPVAFGHDVRSGGLAEARIGAGQGARNQVFLPVGTGIAAALLVDGRPVTGDGYAGELGHVVVDPGGAACRCGGRGCLETVASASAIARRYAERTGRPAGDAGMVAARVRAGEADACAVWNEAVRDLAGALATCVTLLAPELVVIGGGLARSGELLLAPLRTALEARLTYQRRPRLVRAALGEHAGCLGAGLRALEVLP
jgi:glucokinase